MDKAVEIAILQEKVSAHHDRLDRLELITDKNAVIVANLVTGVAVLAGSVDLLVKIAYGGIAVVVIGVLVAVVRLVVTGFGSS